MAPPPPAAAAWTVETATAAVTDAIRLVGPPPADGAAVAGGRAGAGGDAAADGRAAAIRWASRLVPPAEVVLVLDADVRVVGGWAAIDRCVRAAVLEGQAVFPVVAASFPLPPVDAAAAAAGGAARPAGGGWGGRRRGTGWLTRSYAVMCARRYDYDEMLD